MNVSLKEQLALKVIDTWLYYRQSQSSIPGIQACIRKKGEIIFEKAYGFANNISEKPLSKDHIFHIASHSKTFTSCLILQLAEQDKLNLLHPIVKYIPELGHHKDSRFKKITIRDLLSNRSGIVRDGLEDSFWNLERPFPSKDKLLQEVLGSYLVYEPNTETKYSNYGFALLGIIIEKVCELSYDNAIKKYIFDKLDESKIYSDFNTDSIKEFADGHSRPLEKGQRIPLNHIAASSLASATGLCARARDTTQFFSELFLNNKLINEQSKKELLSLKWQVKNSEENERYGLGISFDTFGDIELAGHSGGYPGFTTDTSFWIGTEYVFSAFLNCQDRACLSITRSIAEILNKVNTYFDDEEIKEAKLSGILTTISRSNIFIITPKKGLTFYTESWLPCQSVSELKASELGAYLCLKENGYNMVGENITFKEDQEGNIIQAKWGPTVFLPESEFRKNLNKVRLE